MDVAMPKPETTLPPQEVTPDPVLEKRVRRVFTTNYKLRILREADSCTHGEVGEILRREKLYHAQLSQWRREFAALGVEGLSKTSPGPKPTLSADAKRIAQLEKENQRLQRELLVKEHCLELQKKTLSLIEAFNQKEST
jgi:transposase-like protein